MDIGTPLGLAFASGINAYLPLLAFALSTRFLHLYKLNPNFAFVTSDWFMIALLVLTIADLVADKFPVIDHTWDAVHTVIRPIAGALVAGASYGQFHLPDIHTGTAYAMMPQAMMAATSGARVVGMVVPPANITVGGAGLIIMLIVGGLLALMSHMAKATTRLFSTASTAGLLNIGISTAEDVLVVILVLLSIFVPIIMLILIGLFLIVFGPRLFRAWGRRMNRREGI